MCVRTAKRNNQQLGEYFWQTVTWKLIYQKQILAANNLLKVYTFQSIINALNNKNKTWISTLWYKNLPELIVLEQDKIDKENLKMNMIIEKERKTQESTPAFTEPEVKTQPFGNKRKNLD